MLSRCQGAARTSCSARAGSEGGNKTSRVCDLPHKNSGSLARQGQEQSRDSDEAQHQPRDSPANPLQLGWFKIQMESQVSLPGSGWGSGPRMYLGWTHRAVMKKRCGQTTEPQLPRESLMGRIFLPAFFMIFLISEGVDLGVNKTPQVSQIASCRKRGIEL